ncbi:MAG: biotin/lipoyl-binding protein, partial [Acidobacteria bacterium]|nr:biotin/lipoyl-binding protein [Acidobacteriota bacterium]
MSDPKPHLDSLRIDRTSRERSGFGWQTWATLVVVIVAAGVAIRWWVVKARAADVTVTVVKEDSGSGSGTAVLNASGYVTARRRATVSSKITGKVVAVMVEEGMRVRRGQVLARLDDASARASLNLAESQL